MSTVEKQIATTTPQGAGSIIQVIERAALNPDVDIDKMERLLQMHERILSRDAEKAFNIAMSAAQSEMGRVSADKRNSQTKSDYASYAAIDREVRPIYTEHGFSLSFDTGETTKADCLRVKCIVSHRDGYSRTYSVDMPADGKGAKGGDVMTKTHATGAAMQYGMRYLLKMIFNVAIGDDDSDGNMPSDTITEDQAKMIRDLLKETKSDETAFLAYIGAESVNSMLALSFNKAMQVLNAKKRKANA